MEKLMGDAGLVGLFCDVCGYVGQVRHFLVVNQEYVCPRCLTDESGLDPVPMEPSCLPSVDGGRRVDYDPAMRSNESHGKGEG